MEHCSQKALSGLLQAQHLEMKRSLEATYRSRQPRPYFLSYLSKVGDKFSVWSRFGGTMAPKNIQFQKCFVDLRVGSPEFDQLERGGLSDNNEEADSVELMELPLRGDQEAMRYALWRLTDARYKEAAKAYHEKLSRLAEYEGVNQKSYSLGKLREHNLKELLIPDDFFSSCGQLEDVDTELWQNYTSETSLVAKGFRDLWSSYVEFHARRYWTLFYSSEGILRIQKQTYFGLTGYYWFKSPGKTGMDLDGTLNFWGPSAHGLPDLATFKEAWQERLEEAQSLHSAKKIRSYSGPVLLNPKAAGLLIHEVLGHRVEASRLLCDDEGQTFEDKLGEKITHPDLYIYDDPSAADFEDTPLIGHYKFDDEGSLPAKAEIISEGKLAGYLHTRTPSPESADRLKHQSSGHARCDSFQRPISRMANLFVHAKNGLAFAELKSAFVEMVKKSGKKYGLWIIDVEGGETGTDSYDFQAFKGEVLLAKKIFPDGREEWVRGVDLVGTPLSALSSIAAVGDKPEVDNGFCGAESGTVPVSTVCPAMIVQKLELQSKEQKKTQMPPTEIPWHRDFPQTQKGIKDGQSNG